MSLSEDGRRRTNRLAVAALVCAVLWGLGLLSVVALILGVVARGQIRERGEGGDRLATAAAALGAVGIVASVAVALVVAAGTEDEGPDSDGPATVLIETAPETCWVAVVRTGGAQVVQTEEEGCGSTSRELGTGAGRSAVVRRGAGSGPLTVVLVIDGEEADRRVTTVDGGTVRVEP